MPKHADRAEGICGKPQRAVAPDRTDLQDHVNWERLHRFDSALRSRLGKQDLSAQGSQLEKSDNGVISRGLVNVPLRHFERQ